MAPYHYRDEEPTAATSNCAVSGCPEAGAHKAPLSPDRPGQYQWFCLDHIREFNKKWDFFKGRSQSEIEAFQKDATYGHRPTWRISEAEKLNTAALQDALGRFMGGAASVASKMAGPPLGAKDRHALEMLDLPHPSTRDTIKTRYKKLVKRYHPDTNPDDKNAADRFREVNEAYNHLIRHYSSTITNA